MSRVGKNPVPIPAGVTIDLKGQHLKAKGKRGELQLMVHDDVSVAQDGDKLVFAPRSDSRRARMQWGTARNLASNVVRGVSDGFTVKLEINGVGYRAQADAKVLKLQLGYSHDVEVAIPAGIQIKAPRPTEVEISGADRQKVGQLAAEIRSLRPPEPYKGKGIKYSTETIRRKEGKKK
jgi:large subunit ribosomal protein L6